MMLPLSFLKSKKSESDKQPLVVRFVAGLVRRWKLIIGIIAIVFGITQTAGFTSFIIEEKQQQLGFGVFSYLQAKQWEPARDSLLWCLDDAKRDMRAYKVLNVLNPLTGWAFTDYGKANIRKIQWQLDSVDRRLGRVEEQLAALDERTMKPLRKATLQDSTIMPPKMIDYKPHAQRVGEVLQEAKEWVYVTPNGKKYHRRTCRYGKSKGATRITIEDAIREGYEKCKMKGCR